MNQIDAPSTDCQRVWAAKGWLASRGLTQKGLARAIGAYPAAINKVILGHRRTPAVIEYLTKSVGMPADLLPEPRKPKPKKTVEPA
ncbi:MAG: XRE family transcriptional regulator [Deltaproteobacteria bacterium]|nr:XRE family transcriptional regulator [Deltaproteobacteria bacterium]